MYRILLKKGITKGSLSLKFSNGEEERFGTGQPQVTWLLKSRNTIRRIARNWEYQLGETYINGEWSVENGEVFDLLCLLRINFRLPKTAWSARFSALLLKLQQGSNSIGLSHANISHYYDLDATLFSCFLDKEMHYSCAYYEKADAGLDEAQRAKCAHICSKLALSPGQTVLDIGSGWGSMAVYMARHYDVRVVGLTLSKEQFSIANKRVKMAGLDHLIEFNLEDYRLHAGRYDRIVSIGMFEHVGRRNFYKYFKMIDKNLTEQGIALVHTIGRTGFPRRTNRWIRKYIFPGGYLPSLSEVSRALEKTNLGTTDVEVLRRHYEMTVKDWRKKFLDSRQTFVDSKGETFTRVWEFYLNICEAAFRHTDISVFQVQMAKNDDVLPITRDYLVLPT